MSNIKAFVRGGREGIDLLRRVLPNIFRTFPGIDPGDVLAECGLKPMPTGDKYPSFCTPIFNDSGVVQIGVLISKKRSREEEEKDEDARLFRSQELMEAYEAARSEWSS